MRKTQQMPRLIISFAAISLLVGGCAHGGNIFDLMNPKQQPRINQATFCDVMNQRGGGIRWSAKDTRGTKEQVDAVNAAYVRLCRRTP